MEALGVEDPDIDVEVIALLAGFYRDLGLGATRLLLNSMGDAETRPGFVAALRAHFLRHGAALGDEFLARVEANPLRVLDAKVEAWQDVIGSAPQLSEHLSDASAAQFEAVQAGLRALGVDFELAPRLVRGFDYYTATTFEFQNDALDAAQNALGGGGRYDGLAEEMGGPPTPGIGFGTGLERIVLALAASGVPAPAASVDLFVVDGLGDQGGPTVGGLVESLRTAGFAVDRAYGGRSVKAQWKAADRSGAAVAVMVGRDELTRDAVAVKDLATGEQVEVPRAELVARLVARKDGA